MEKFHKGVGAIITTPDKSLFYLQQKDETYPIEKWRMALSVWGGAMEIDDTSEESALRRELIEELDWENPPLINRLGEFLVESDQVFPITIFEIVLTETELLHFAANKVSNEGYAVLKTAAELWDNNWVWDLDSILKPIYQKL